jgi:hypothetical protein
LLSLAEKGIMKLFFLRFFFLRVVLGVVVDDVTVLILRIMEEDDIS